MEREHERHGRGRRGTGSAARGPVRARRSVRRGQSARRSKVGETTESVVSSTSAHPDKPHTGGAFGLSATRRAAVLATVVCALALTVAVPLRTYLTQHAQVQQELARQADLQAQQQQLEQRAAELSDPQRVQTEARKRLRMVLPGEIPYFVQLPGDGQQQNEQEQQQKVSKEPWYQQLWDSITGDNS